MIATLALLLARVLPTQARRTSGALTTVAAFGSALPVRHQRVVPPTARVLVLPQKGRRSGRGAQ